MASYRKLFILIIGNRLLCSFNINIGYVEVYISSMGIYEVKNEVSNTGEI